MSQKKKKKIGKLKLKEVKLSESVVESEPVEEIYGINVNKLGKTEKNQNVKEGKCIFPFKYKWKEHNKCVETEKGDICATEINPKTRTLKKYGYCTKKQARKKSKKRLKIKSKSKDSESIKISEAVIESEPVDLLNTLEELYNNIPDDDAKKEKKKLNEFKIKRELLNRETLSKQKDDTYLYPTLDDPLFNIKIASKKEFNETQYDGKIHDNIEEEGDKLCNADFELASHQIFVRNFLSFQTPYNSLLLYHGLGTGKTCSAITIAEEMRDYLKQQRITQRIIVVASPNVQDNFKLQLFDERKLVQGKDKLWNIRGCTGNKYLKEINPMNMKGYTKEKVIKQINRIIKSSYVFFGYIGFANYITRKSKVNSEITDPKKRRRIMKNKLQREFNNRLIIIDEIHNIRMSNVKNNKLIVKQLEKLIKNVDHLRLLLLSATPMYNNYKEIIWLVNLMNLNDNRSTIDIGEVFNKNGNFIEGGRELLERKLTGYVSYIRGDNPYTFPYRIWPMTFDKKNTFKNKSKVYPKLQLNGKEIEQPLRHIDVFLVKIGSYQSKGYQYIIDNIKSKDTSVTAFKDLESFGYTVLQKPLEALNIVYPYDKLGDYKSGDKQNWNSDLLVGKSGLSRIMKYDEKKSPPVKNNFEYKPSILEKYGRIFSEENIEKYSGKIKNICNSVKHSEGIILIYSQYIDGGLVPIALALEEMGLTRYGNVSSLFKKPPVKSNGQKYIMISGDGALSPDTVSDFKALTNVNNVNGEKIKVVLISQAGSEGLDFKYVRQVHILDPWYNMNRIEQIIGRAVRNCSHKDLPFKKRNVQIFLYGTLLEDKNKEAIDLYIYRLAEAKAILMGEVSRVIKKNAVDCILNKGQTKFLEKNMKAISILLSNMKEINYNIGDKPYSAICDYMESCDYLPCNPNKDINRINIDTYNEKFIKMNVDKIIQRIKDLYKEKYFYNKADLLKHITIKKYPLTHVDAALTQLIKDKNEYISDRYGRRGNLINIGDLYLYQPLEITDERISLYERSTPIEYKRSYLEYSLSDDNKVILETNQEDSNELLQTMGKNYNTSLLDADKLDAVINKGKNDWYNIAQIAIEIILHNKNKFENNVTKERLYNFVIAHIIETLTYENHKILLNYLWENDELSELEKKYKQYYEKHIMRAKGLSGVLLQYKNISQYKLLILKNKVWKEAEPEDINDLIKEVRKLIIKRDNISNIVGFITYFKNNYLVFKIKNMYEKRSKGLRCDQGSITKNMNDNMKKIMGIAHDDEFKLDIPDEHKKGKKDKTDHINLNVYCVIQELILRLFEYNKKNNKTWYFTPAEASVNGIEEISF